jgi:hypothetical protein
MALWFQIREPVNSFTGREAELEALHGFLSRKGRNENETTLLDQVAIVAGLGGVGKSDLARKYARRYQEDYDGNAIWINAETANSMSASLSALSRELGLPATGLSLSVLIAEIFKRFTSRKSLFIFDNVEELDVLSLLPQCLPPDDKKPFILITSRKQKWQNGVEVLVLPVLPEDDAVALIKKSLRSGSTCDNMVELAETLQRLPLDLQ